MSYQSDRFDAIAAAEAKITDKELKALGKKYRLRIKEIDREITWQLSQLAADNSVSIQKAHELLSKSELEEFRWKVDEYIEAAEKNGISEDWTRKLKNASRKARITRLDAAKTAIRMQAEMIYAEINKTHTSVAEKTYHHAYGHMAHEAQRGIGVGISLSMPDTDRIRKLAASGWARDGLHYSDRIWRGREKLARTVEDLLTNAAIRGDSIEKSVNDLMSSINESVPRWQIERLIRTESAFMSTAAQLDLFGDLGADCAKFLATLDEKACGSCGSLDGTIIPLDDARAGRTVPPVHPNCRCVLVPVWSHDKDNPKLKSAYRAARDPETGKTVDVPYMNYDQWKSAFLDGKAEKVRPMSGAEAAWTAYAETAIGPDAGIPYKNILKDADGRPLVDDRPFTTIGSAKELNKFMEKNCVKTQKLTKGERGAIYDYTVDSSKMNTFCRIEGGSFVGESAPSLESLLEEKEKVSLLDSAIAKSVLLQDLVTYRAISMPHSFPGVKSVSGTIGKTYTDDAFMSSSPLLSAAARVADLRGTDIILRMKIRAGSGKGLYVNEYSDKKGVEYEFLLARKGKYIVESYDYVPVNGKTYTIITVSEST